MRILHILDHSIPINSSYSLRTQAILKMQRASGWETIQLTGPRQGPVTANEEIVDDWEFNRTAPPGGLLENIPVLSELELMGEMAHRIEQIVKRVRPHILHAHSPALNAIAALRVGRRIGTPVVYEVRAFWEDLLVGRGAVREGGLCYRLNRSLETRALKRADAVTTIGNGMRANIVSRGVAAEKVTVIPNGVDADRFSVNGVPDRLLGRSLGLNGALVLGFIGSYNAYEGLSDLLCALPEIVSQVPRVRVLLVGSGAQEVHLKQMAHDLGFGERVVFAPPLPQAELQRYFDLIDVLAYPRLSMQYTEMVPPLKVLQAMARGSLIAASDVGGHRELIRDGETGVLFKAGDPQSLAAAVVRLLNSPERWSLLKAATRKSAETEHSWESAMARQESVYARVTDQLWRT
jgi:PEP-CTERM/exosortase A-associated glycosyltransferase